MSLVLLSLLSVAGAEGPLRLVLVGDSGYDTAIARVVASALQTEAAAADAVVHTLAAGDLFYNQPPKPRGCVDKVEERYRLFYDGLPRVHAVAGNHDLSHPRQHQFSEKAYRCTEAAFQRMGWLESGASLESRVVSLEGAGVTVELALIEAGYYGDGLPVPSLTLRPDADWHLYLNHYVWRTTSEKCSEQGRISDWLGSPPMDLWINGHAHHLGAVAVDGALAVTSGAGMGMRDSAPCKSDTLPEVTPLFFYSDTNCDSCGGYVVLDLPSATEAVLTPVTCTVEQGCQRQEALRCTRDGVRGVQCAP